VFYIFSWLRTTMCLREQTSFTSSWGCQGTLVISLLSFARLHHELESIWCPCYLLAPKADLLQFGLLSNYLFLNITVSRPSCVWLFWMCCKAGGVSIRTYLYL
jgi:hypothetical protein